MNPSLKTTAQQAITFALARAKAETTAPANQLTPWEAVAMDDGTVEIKAQFKEAFGRKVWHTLFEQAYCTGATNTAHNGLENAVRIAWAMNLAYPCLA